LTLFENKTREERNQSIGKKRRGLNRAANLGTLSDVVKEIRKDHFETSPTWGGSLKKKKQRGIVA